MALRNKPWIAMDIETKNDVRDFNNPQDSGFAIGVIYNSADNSLISYDESMVGEFINALRNAGRVIGYNHERFDLRVLEPYFEGNDAEAIRKVSQVDILSDFYNSPEISKRFRVPLANIAEQTAKIRLIMDGYKMPSLFRQGMVQSVIQHCKQDVRATAEIYKFGLKNGYIQYWDELRSKTKKVNVDWGEAK